MVTRIITFCVNLSLARGAVYRINTPDSLHLGRKYLIFSTIVDYRSLLKSYRSFFDLHRGALMMG